MPNPIFPNFSRLLRAKLNNFLKKYCNNKKKRTYVIFNNIFEEFNVFRKFLNLHQNCQTFSKSDKLLRHVQDAT